MLTGSQIALWCIAAMGVVLSSVKLVEWLCVVSGLTKPAEQKTREVLEPDMVKLREIHEILSDKVFAKEQEGRFDDIAYIKGELDRVLPWLKTPPEVSTPPFYCQGANSDQMELVIKLLQEILVRKGE